MAPRPGRTPTDETIFAAAVALPSAARGPYLDEICGPNRALRAKVESLLQANDEACDFMEASPLELEPDHAPLRTVPIGETPGTRVGRYKLLQKLGEGGCGVVYLAEQQESVRRRVALKIIKLGLDTKAVVSRFEAERQALARMEHPNIARVLDAGATDSGRPFFVMELVRGLKITQYCDQNNLSMEQRLRLFIKVCQAIHHAHQKGIIHRDIKPSNILVTLHDGEPVPKVIDFGIAKATHGRLADDTVFTAYEQFIGTPAYVAPEQAEMSGLDVDTRSDIYSLGVLLYELLTGRTPFDTQELMRAGLDAMRRTICEQQPPRPSMRLRTLNDEDRTTVARRRGTDAPRLTIQLKGDLDWIVMRCLEKDRTRRYEGANDLGLDIERYLDNEPVAARPPSTVYLLQKLLRRHRFAVAAGAALFVTLAAGFAVSTLLYLRQRDALERARVAEARAQEDKAVAQKARAEIEASNLRLQIEVARRAQLTAMMMGNLKDVGVAMARDPRALKEYLDRMAARKKEIGDQPEVEAGMTESLAGTYFTLGEYVRAEELFREARQLRARLHGENSPQAAQSLNHLGLVQSAQGHWSEAERSHEQALRIQQAGLRDHPEGAAEVAHTHSTLGWALAQQARLPEAEHHLNLAIEQQRSLLGARDPEVAASLMRLGSVLTQAGRVSTAEDKLQQALAINTAAFGEESPEVVRTLNLLAVTVGLDFARLPEAIGMYRRAFDLRRRLDTTGKTGPAARKTSPGDAPPSLEALLGQRDALVEIESALKEARYIAQQQYPKDSWEVAFYLALTGWVMLQEQKFAEAESIIRECLAIRQKLRPDDWSTHHARHLLGDALAGQNKFAAAEPLLIEGYQGMKARAATIPAFHLPRLGESAQRIARFYQTLGGRRAEVAKWKAEFEGLDAEAQRVLLSAPVK